MPRFFLYLTFYLIAAIVIPIAMPIAIIVFFFKVSFLLADKWLESCQQLEDKLDS